MKTIFGIFNRVAMNQVSLWLALTLVFVATPSVAAKILNLRTGKNAEYTRVVIELDQPTTYQSAEQSGAAGAELVITVKASGQAQALDVSTRFVNSIQVKPSGAETRIIVQLARAGAPVKDFVLQNPPRIVFDVAAGGKVAAATVEPAPTKPAPPAPVATPTKPATTTPPSAPPKPAPEKVEEAKQASPKSVDATPPPVTRDSASTVKPEEVASEEQAVVEPSLEEGTSGENAVPEDTQAPSAKAPKVAPAKKSAAAPKSFLEQMFEPIAPITQQLEGLPALIGAAALVVLFLLFLLFKQRQKRLASARSQAAADDASDEADDDSLFGGEPWEANRAATPKKAEPEPMESLMSEFSSASTPRSPAPAAPRSPAPPSQSFVSAAPPPAAPVDAVSKADFEAFEARVKGLEDQLNGFAAARERLETQIKSQAEELRVQRAAIARTQRVVRSLASAEDDMPAEPAPKAPAD